MESVEYQAAIATGKRNRRAIVDRMIAAALPQFLAHAPVMPGARPPSLHWDDCDLEERRFWLYFKAPCLAQARTGDGTSKKLVAAISSAIHEAKKVASEETTYEVYWYRSESPQVIYPNDSDKKQGRGCYVTQTWIYTVHFYGGW